MHLRGDIVAVFDSNKNVVVSYVYDAWGRPISKTGNMAGTLGTVQPFRYRGYVYDEETEQVKNAKRPPHVRRTFCYSLIMALPYLATRRSRSALPITMVSSVPSSV